MQIHRLTRPLLALLATFVFLSESQVQAQLTVNPCSNCWERTQCGVDIFNLQMQIGALTPPDPEIDSLNEQIACILDYQASLSCLFTPGTDCQLIECEICWMVHTEGPCPPSCEICGNWNNEYVNECICEYCTTCYYLVQECNCPPTECSHCGMPFDFCICPPAYPASCANCYQLVEFCICTPAFCPACYLPSAYCECPWVIVCAFCGEHPWFCICEQ